MTQFIGLAALALLLMLLLPRIIWGVVRQHRSR